LYFTNMTVDAVEDVAFGKSSWVVDGRRRAQYRKRHTRRQWTRRHDDHHVQRRRHVISLVVDGHHGDREACKVLDNSAADWPVLVVDLGRKFSVAGVVVVTSSDAGNNETGRSLVAHARIGITTYLP